MKTNGLYLLLIRIKSTMNSVRHTAISATLTENFTGWKQIQKHLLHKNAKQPITSPKMKCNFYMLIQACIWYIVSNEIHV